MNCFRLPQGAQNPIEGRNLPTSPPLA